MNACGREQWHTVESLDKTDQPSSTQQLFYSTAPNQSTPITNRPLAIGRQITAMARMGNAAVGRALWRTNAIAVANIVTFVFIGESQHKKGKTPAETACRSTDSSATQQQFRPKNRQATQQLHDPRLFLNAWPQRLRASAVRRKQSTNPTTTATRFLQHPRATITCALAFLKKWKRLGQKLLGNRVGCVFIFVHRDFDPPHQGTPKHG